MSFPMKTKITIQILELPLNWDGGSISHSYNPELFHSNLWSSNASGLVLIYPINPSLSIFFSISDMWMR